MKAKIPTTNYTAFYFANKHNDRRASKGGKVRFYGPFESRLEANYHAAAHNGCEGTHDLFDLTNDEREDAELNGILFQDPCMAGYFTEAGEFLPYKDVKNELRISLGLVD